MGEQGIGHPLATYAPTALGAGPGGGVARVDRAVCLLLLFGPAVATTSFLRVSAAHRLGVAILFLIVLASARWVRRPQADVVRGSLVWAFVALTSIGFVRLALDPAYPISAIVALTQLASLLAFVLFVWTVLTAQGPPRIMQRRLTCAVFAPAAFVWLNVLLLVVGFSFGEDPATASRDPGRSQLLALVGIGADRLSLPLIPGLNGNGAMGALAIVTCFAMRDTQNRTQRLFARATLPLALLSIVLTDSRGALLFAVLAILALISVSRWSNRSVAWLPLLLPIAPSLILYGLNAAAGLGNSLSRNPGDFTTATGRADVWAEIYRFLAHPQLEHLVGYGAYGHVQSGIGFRYAYLFPSDDFPEFNGAHNVILQTVLDHGYIGAAVFIALLVTAVRGTARGWQRTGSPEIRALLGGVLLAVLLGASEAVPTVLSSAALMTFIVLVVAISRDWDTVDADGDGRSTQLDVVPRVAATPPRPPASATAGSARVDGPQPD